MKARVVLVARVNDGTKTFPSIPVEIHRRAIVTPIMRKADPQNGRAPQTFGLGDIVGFYARYPKDGKRVVKPLGKDPVAAYTQFLRIEQDFGRIRIGLLPLNPPEPEPDPKNDRRLKRCAAEYKAELVTRGLKKTTRAAYARAIDDFLALCPKRLIDDVDRKDILTYVDWIRTHLKGRKNGGDRNYTIKKRMQFLTSLFIRFGLKCPLPRKEIKKPVKTRPWKYSTDVINLFLKHADRDEKDLIHFLLNTGFRDEETVYATWSDLDLKAGSINVHPKPQYANMQSLGPEGWTPKDGESREQDIVLDSRFVRIMKARKQRMQAKDSDLIFPSTRRMPDQRLISRLHRAARKASYEGKVAMHAFRRTFGSIVARHRGIEQARIWLGHEDIETTQRYIAADEMTTEHARRIAGQMFAEIGD